MDWLWKFAESYGGTRDSTNPQSTSDGSESLDSRMQDPLYNGGVQTSNEYQQATMPYSLDVHDKQNSQADKDKPNPHRSDEYSDFPFGEQAVDDNHANNVTTSASLFEGNDVAGAGANFLHHAPDSPVILHDGHPPAELEEQQGVNSVSNNFVSSKPTPEVDEMFIHDPRAVGKNKYQNIPEINKGRTAVQRGLNPFARSAREIPNYNTGSNVEDIMYPDEEDRKHRRSTQDFGTGDQSGDNRTMEDTPFGDPNYSGIQPTSSADATLKNYLEKIGYYKRQADYGAVSPTMNPNSGIEPFPVSQPRVMLDGKLTPELADKVDFDPTKDRKRRRYEGRTEDTEHYYNVSNTGSGFGSEGDGQNFSGIQPDN